MKVSAKHSLKRHYLVFAAVCLIAGFLGTQFTGQFDFVKMPTSFTREDTRVILAMKAIRSLLG